jgi:hypothetical protein
MNGMSSCDAEVGTLMLHVSNNIWNRPRLSLDDETIQYFVQENVVVIALSRVILNFGRHKMRYVLYTGVVMCAFDDDLVTL